MYTLLSFPMLEDAQKMEEEALQGHETPAKDAFQLITELLKVA